MKFSFVKVKKRTPFPSKKYDIIYADPPWTYRDKALAGKRGAGCKYKTMLTERIQNLPVSDISKADCVLFLWITMPLLAECFGVIDAWGFEYKTCGFVWVKHYKHAGSPVVGMGNWTRANAEVCLLATRGSPKRISKSVSQVVEAPTEKPHSKKPGVVRDKIVELLGDLPRIELFATERVSGWDAWGDEL